MISSPAENENNDQVSERFFSSSTAAAATATVATNYGVRGQPDANWEIASASASGHSPPAQTDTEDLFNAWSEPAKPVVAEASAAREQAKFVAPGGRDWHPSEWLL